MNLSVQIGKLTLQNPVMVASGTFGYGVEYAQLLDLNQLGAVVVKGIRLHSGPRQSHAPHRRSHQRHVEPPSACKGRARRLHQKYWPFLKKLKVPTIITSGARPSTNMSRWPDGSTRWAALARSSSMFLPQHQGRRRTVRHRHEAARAGGGRLSPGDKTPAHHQAEPNVCGSCFRQVAEDAGSDALSIMNSYPAMAIDMRRASPGWRISPAA